MNIAGMQPPATALAAEGAGAGAGAGAPVLFPESVLFEVPSRGGAVIGAMADCGAALTTVGAGARAGLMLVLGGGVAAGCAPGIDGDVFTMGIAGDVFALGIGGGVFALGTAGDVFAVGIGGDAFAAFGEVAGNPARTTYTERLGIVSARCSISFTKSRATYLQMRHQYSVQAVQHFKSPSCSVSGNVSIMSCTFVRVPEGTLCPPRLRPSGRYIN